MSGEHEPKGELMPDTKLSEIIERLEAQGDVNLPDDIITATELACTLRQIADVFGGDVNRYLFGKAASIQIAYGGTPTVTGRFSCAEPNTIPATLTVDGEKPRVKVLGVDLMDGWPKMKTSLDRELAKFAEINYRKPAGILVSRDLANAIGEKMSPGEAAALHYEGITVVVSEKIHGFGWEWIW